MSKQIVTATPIAFDLGPGTVPILPHWVLNGSPLTRTKQLLRSRDYTSNIVVWECSAGSFNWHYNQDEMVVIVAGEVFITNEKGEERRLGPCDMAFFPAGTVVKWRVPQCVRKVAIVRETLWWPAGFALKAYKKLLRMVGLGGESPL